MDLKQRMKLYEASHQREKLILNESLFEDTEDITDLVRRSTAAYKELKKYRKGSKKYKEAYAAWLDLHAQVTKKMYGGNVSFTVNEGLEDGIPESKQAYTDKELSDMAYEAIKWWYSQPDMDSIYWSDLMMKVHDIDMDSMSREEVAKLNKYLDEYSDDMDGVGEDDATSSVTDENSHAITTMREASRWLERQIAEYGNTYFFPPDIRRILNNLINEFGSTYFWHRVSESLSEADIPEKDPIIAPAVEEESHEASEVVTTPEENGIQNMVQFLIKDEWDAIEGYNNTIQTLKDMGGYDDLCGVLQEISNEELVHVGQLQKALEFVNPVVAKIKEGETEATEQMTEPVVAPQEVENV